MKKLIIAEKPSQAEVYATTIGIVEKKNGYYVCKDNYIITWCYGHLVKLANDKTYTKKEKWEMTYLPLILNKQSFIYQSEEKHEKHIGIIKSLIDQSDLVINGTDADREGELIFRTIKKVTSFSKPFKRLWLNSLEASDVKKGLNNLIEYSNEVDKTIKTDIAKTSLAAELRQQFDWLVGVNGTQTMTLTAGKGRLLTIGRVQSVVLKIITERYLENKSHQKTYTFQILSEHKELSQTFISKTKIFETENECNSNFSKLGKEYKVTDYNESIVKEHPPLLYSLNTLIMEGNEMFKYSSMEILDICQKLYDNKMITYPRTDCCYINEEKYEKMNQVIPELASSLLGIEVGLNPKPKSVDNTKLDSSHDAIVPTGITDYYMQLTEKEKNLYHLIIIKTIESFDFESKYNQKVMKLDNNAIEFVATSKTVNNLGFKKYRKEYFSTKDDEETESKDLPKYAIGAILTGTPKINKIESKPKPLYTGATLTTTLMKIGQHLKKEGWNLEEIEKQIPIKEVELGTDNTRVHIIKRLIDLNYIELKHNKYYPTELGLKYYELIKDLEVVNVITTINNEINLRKIEKGEMTENEFRTEMEKYIVSIVEDIKTKGEASTIDFNEKKEYGKCLLCDGKMLKGEKSFYCSNWKIKECKCVIWRKQFNKQLTDQTIIDLIQSKKSKEIKGFKNSSGVEYAASLELIIESNEIKIKPIFKPFNNKKK